MFSIFSSKKRLVETDLLMGMTDVHTHLLYGVDDGVTTRDEAVAAVAYYEEMGMGRVFLTPHVMTNCPLNNAASLKRCFEEFKAQINSKIEFHLAAEYMLDEHFTKHLEDGLLTYDGKHVLVETSYLSAPLELDTLVYDILASGYQPVLAHPERYLYMSDVQLQQLLAKGVKLQLNLTSLAGCYGTAVTDRAKSLLLEGKYSFAGTDFHNQRSYERHLPKIALKKQELRALGDVLQQNNSL